MLRHVVRYMKWTSALIAGVAGAAYVAPRVHAFSQPTPTDPWGNPIAQLHAWEKTILYTELSIGLLLRSIFEKDGVLWLGTEEAADAFVRLGGLRLLIHSFHGKVRDLHVCFNADASLRSRDELIDVLHDLDVLLRVLNHVETHAGLPDIYDWLAPQTWTDIATALILIKSNLNGSEANASASKLQQSQVVNALAQAVCDQLKRYVTEANNREAIPQGLLAPQTGSLQRSVLSLLDPIRNSLRPPTATEEHRQRCHLMRNATFHASPLPIPEHSHTELLPDYVQASLACAMPVAVGLHSGGLLAFRSLSAYFNDLKDNKEADWTPRLIALQCIADIYSHTFLKQYAVDWEAAGISKGLTTFVSGATNDWIHSNASVACTSTVSQSLRLLASVLVCRRVMRDAGNGEGLNSVIEVCRAANAFNDASRGAIDEHHSTFNKQHNTWSRQMLVPAIQLAANGMLHSQTKPSLQLVDAIVLIRELCRSDTNNSGVNSTQLLNVSTLRVPDKSDVWQHSLNQLLANASKPNETASTVLESATELQYSTILSKEKELHKLDTASVGVVAADLLTGDEAVSLTHINEKVKLNLSAREMQKWSQAATAAMQCVATGRAYEAGFWSVSLQDPPHGAEARVFPSLADILTHSLHEPLVNIPSSVNDAVLSSKDDERRQKVRTTAVALLSHMLTAEDPPQTQGSTSHEQHTALQKRYIAELWLYNAVIAALHRVSMPEKAACLRQINTWFTVHMEKVNKEEAGDTVLLPLQRFHPRMQAQLLQRVHQLADAGNAAPANHEAFLPPHAGSLAFDYCLTKGLAYLLVNSSPSAISELRSCEFSVPLMCLMENAAKTVAANKLEGVALLRQASRAIANVAAIEPIDEADRSAFKRVETLLQELKNVANETKDTKLFMQTQRAMYNLHSKHPIGDMLYPLHVPADSNYDVDVVLVHGLQGGALKTWRAQNTAASPSDITDGDSLPYYHTVDREGKRLPIWPATWLVQDLRELGYSPRILSVSYDAPMFARGSIRPDKALHIVASELQNQLTAAGVGFKPTVVIAHSLGGLLTKYLLSHTNSTELRNNVVACAFYAVPHFGSDHAKAAMTVSNSLAAIQKYLPTLTSSHVQQLGNSEQLLRLHKQFQESIAQADVRPAIIDFIEGRKTRIANVALLRLIGVNWHDQLVVPPKSGDSKLGVLHPVEQADHISICKPTSRQDPAYQHLLQTIAKALDSRTHVKPPHSSSPS